MPTVDLGIDLGERAGEPSELYALATVVNIACGGHAGDTRSMAVALAEAKVFGAKAAAHVAYPDRVNFGRLRLALGASELAASIESQCAELQTLARAKGRPVKWLKAQGALADDCTEDSAIARAVLDGADRGLGSGILTVIGWPDGALLAEARRRGHHTAREGYADRGYGPDGRLLPRTSPRGLLTDPVACSRQAVALATRGGFELLSLRADTVGAIRIASVVRDALEQKGLLAGSP